MKFSTQMLFIHTHTSNWKKETDSILFIFISCYLFMSARAFFWWPFKNENQMKKAIIITEKKESVAFQKGTDATAAAAAVMASRE